MPSAWCCACHWHHQSWVCGGRKLCRAGPSHLPLPLLHSKMLQFWNQGVWWGCMGSTMTCLVTAPPQAQSEPALVPPRLRSCKHLHRRALSSWGVKSVCRITTTAAAGEALFKELQYRHSASPHVAVLVFPLPPQLTKRPRPLTITKYWREADDLKMQAGQVKLGEGLDCYHSREISPTRVSIHRGGVCLKFLNQAYAYSNMWFDLRTCFQSILNWCEGQGDQTRSNCSSAGQLSVLIHSMWGESWVVLSMCGERSCVLVCEGCT